MMASTGQALMQSAQPIQAASLMKAYFDTDSDPQLGSKGAATRFNRVAKL